MYTVQTAWNWGWVTVTHPHEFREALRLLDIFRVSHTARLWKVGEGPVDV